MDDDFGIGLGRAADAAVERVDARRQLGGGEGLGDIVVRAGHKARDLVHFLRARREHDDADGLVRRTDAAADLEAVDIRQHDVQNGHAGVRVFLQALKRLAAGPGLDGLIARPLEIDDDEAADADLVLQNQYLFHASLLFLPSAERRRLQRGSVRTL